MTTIRQLAAIMFTDIVGYTKLMGDDESQALLQLRKNRNLHKSIIKKYNGKWLKEMGYGKRRINTAHGQEADQVKPQALKIHQSSLPLNKP